MPLTTSLSSSAASTSSTCSFSLPSSSLASRWHLHLIISWVTRVQPIGRSRIGQRAWQIQRLRNLMLNVAWPVTGGFLAWSWVESVPSNACSCSIACKSYLYHDPTYAPHLHACVIKAQTPKISSMSDLLAEVTESVHFFEIPSSLLPEGQPRRGWGRPLVRVERQQVQIHCVIEIL